MQRIIDKMQEFIEEQNDVNDWLVSQYNADWISSFIDSQPTADVVEVKHGKWIYNRGQAYGEPLFFCSLCVEGESSNGYDNYCPYCGAIMDGESED